MSNNLNVQQLLNEITSESHQARFYFQQQSFKLILSTLLLITSSSILLKSEQSTMAESCIPFAVIGGEGYEVQKEVSIPGLFGPYGLKLKNNWNTDFAIEPLKLYNQYLTTFIAQSQGEYTIRVYLKYSDNTNDEVYNQKVMLTPGEELSITGKPQNNKTPYQVNVFVGEPASTGLSYKISVKGCN